MSDEAARKFELLKLARTITNEEYINRRAEEHNRWVHANDHSLKHTRMRAPYPPFTPYPSEAVIIAKALALYNFMMTPGPVAQPSMPALALTEIELPVPETAPVIEEVPLPVAVEEPAPIAEEVPLGEEPALTLVEEEVTPVESTPALVYDHVLGLIEPDRPELTSESHILPGWVKGWIRK